MKHLIKIESVAHGVLGMRHAGLDQQYCEAGEIVTLKWQPDAGWGLQEAHYTDGDGNVTAIEYGEFTMPNKEITIGGTFRRFSAEDWADNPYPRPNSPRYLKFTANEDGSSVGFCCWSEDYDPVDMGKNMQYSNDGGKTWQDYTIGVGKDNLVAIELDEGESVMFRGVNDNLAYYLEDEDDYIYTKCFIEGSVSASGDVTSLLNRVGGDTTLDSNCYYAMFSGCTGLTTAPSLPATTLAMSCYNSMFSGCTGLTTAPSLPATTLASGCYNSMFSGCTGIVSHDVATLNNSQNTFQNNSSCASLTIHADTPPTIVSSTIAGLKADCVIYVPAASVDVYKAKQYWSARAAYIQAIP